MSERYSRLFSLPENLYSSGSPVVIAAGALLKDNQTGKVIAQLKIQNISPNSIKAVKVCIHPFDIAGNPLGNDVEHMYLDLKASRDEYFGQKTPVVLPDVTTRSFSIDVTEVVFTNNSVWQESVQLQEKLPSPVTLINYLNNNELIRQYRIKFGADCQYKPMVWKGLWYCTCGALNHEEERVCHRCRKNVTSLLNVDLNILKQERDNRVAAEEKKAEEERRRVAEERAAAATRTKRIAIITTPIVCAIIAFIIVLSAVIIPNGKYNDAVALTQQGDYAQAIKEFFEIEGFRDTNKKIEEAIIKAAEDRSVLYEVLDVLPDQYIQNNNAVSYRCAIALLEHGDTVNSYKYFSFCRGYMQARQYLVYLDGLIALDNKEWDEAIENFDSIRDFRDASEHLGDAYYEKIMRTSEISVEDVITTLSKISNKSSKVEKFLASCKSLQKYSSEYTYSRASSGDYSEYRVEFDFFYRWGALYVDPTFGPKGSKVSVNCDPAKVESTYGDYHLYFKSFNNKALYLEFWVSESEVKVYTNVYRSKPTIYFIK